MKRLRVGLLGFCVVVSAAISGCSPFSMGIATPIPMQPWVAEHVAEQFDSKNDHRVPILPPIPPGHRPFCEDPPDRAEILRALPRVVRGIPYIFEEFRDDIEFTVEKLVDKVDPPRFFPLVGPAQLHHCHWKCTVYYTETIDSSWPFPVRVKKRTAQVIYIDKDHLHLCVNGFDAQRETFQQMSAIRPGN